jgi:hypothetical protein
MELAIAVVADDNNPDPGDLYLDATGSTVLHSTLALEVIQRLTVRFSFWFGEYFMDSNEGTPWIQYILTQAPSDQLIRAVITPIITNCEGVDSVTRFTYSISRERRLSVTFTARLSDGSTINSSSFKPFVIDVSRF